MTLTLYYMEASPFVRTVLMAIKALKLDVKYIVVNPLNGETKKPEFLAINPMHTIPTLVDGDFTLWESKAIMIYLVTKYGKDDSLYPADHQKRGEIDRLLYFDDGTLFPRFMKAYFPMIFGGQSSVDEALDEKLHEALAFVDSSLKGKKYITGDNVTIADWCLVTSVLTMSSPLVDISKHTNVVQWLERCKELPYFAEAQQGITAFSDLMKSKLNK